MAAAPRGRATQCPDTDETLDLRVVLSDAQGFRRNDVRWSLSRLLVWMPTPPAPSSAAATRRSTRAPSSRCLLYARSRATTGSRSSGCPTSASRTSSCWPARRRRPRRRLHRPGRPPSGPTMSKMPTTASPSWAPTSGNASRAPSILPSPQPTPRPSYKPHGGAHPAADEPRAFIGAVAHADGAAHSDADARARRRSRLPAPAPVPTPRPTPSAVFGTVVKPVAAAYCRVRPGARARAHVNTVATAVVRTSAGADVRPDLAPVRRTHLEALGAANGAADDRSTHHVESDGRADEPSFRTTIVTPRARAHAQADGVADAHGGPDAAGPLLRLHQNRDGPAPQLVNRGRLLRPEHRSDF